MPRDLGQKQGRWTLANTELPRKQPSCPVQVFQISAASVVSQDQALPPLPLPWA